MAIIATDNAYYSAIADAIRAKSGVTDTYKASEMAEAIEQIPNNSDSLVVTAKNLHDSSTDIANIYIGDGNEISYNGWDSTDFIPIRAGVTYAVCTKPNIDGSYCATYDSDFHYISKFSGGFNSVIGGVSLFKATTDGYIRFSALRKAIASLEMYACIGNFIFENASA